MAAAAQAHFDIEKRHRVSLLSVLFLFMAGPACTILLAALMVADSTVLFLGELITAVVKDNRPEVSFKGYDFRASIDPSLSCKTSAAEGQAYDKNAGQQPANH